MEAASRSSFPLQIADAFYSPAEERLCDAAGDQIFLRAQSAHVLRILIAHGGQIVSRDALTDAVWGDVAVTDDSLTQCISDIRRAIGDRDRRVLKTVPKRGFVLFAEPASPGAGALGEEPRRPGDTVVAAVHGDSVGPRKFTDLREAVADSAALARARQVAIGLDVPGDGADCAADLAALAVPGEVLATVTVRDAAHGLPDMVFEDLGDRSIAPGGPERRLFRLLDRADVPHVTPQVSAADILPTVAILPLRELEPGQSREALGTLFADRVTSALARSEEINVTSRLSAAAFASSDASLRHVGTVLEAEFVLSGLCHRTNDRIVLTMEFAEVASQRVLWSDRMEVAVADLLGPFDPVLEIVAKIRKAILLNEIRNVRARPLDSLRSYSVLFAAVGLMHRLSPSDFDQGRALLDALAQRVPGHPAPLAWTARWHVLRVMQGWSDDPAEDARLALECTRRALDLDPENVLSLVSEGLVLTNLTRRLDEAEDRYNIALEYNPNEAYGRLVRGMLYAFQDKGQDARRDAERALHLAPLDPHRFFYLALAAGANLAAGDHDRAVHLARASLRLNRTHTSTLRMLAVAQHRTGDGASARATIAEMMRLQPGFNVDGWLASTPSAAFSVGQRFAQDLRDLGVPEL